MKYDFSNLNTGTKKQAKGSNWLKPYDTAMLDFDRRYRAVKKMYVEFQATFQYFERQLEGSRDVVDQATEAKVEKLIGAIMKLDFYEIGKSKPWSDLIDLVGGDYGHDLERGLEACSEDASNLKEILSGIVEVINDIEPDLPGH